MVVSIAYLEPNKPKPRFSVLMIRVAAGLFAFIVLLHLKNVMLYIYIWFFFIRSRVIDSPNPA